MVGSHLGKHKSADESIMKAVGLTCQRAAFIISYWLQRPCNLVQRMTDSRPACG